MSTSTRVASALCAVLLALGGAVVAHELPPQTLDRQHAIDAEIAALGAHDWAGSYYAGDGLGYNIHLALSPTAGAVAIWSGCLGIYGSNEGLVLPQPDGSLVLDLTKSNDGHYLIDKHLVPVRWGERRYLIPQAELETFVSAINLGDEPRGRTRGTYLLSHDDDIKPVSGLPDLPPAYARHVRSEPLLLHPTAATLVERKESDPLCELTYRIEFAAGTDDGLAVHSLLKSAGPVRYERVHLTAASAHASSGELHLMGSDCAELPPVDTTWQFTTGAYQPGVVAPVE